MPLSRLRSLARRLWRPLLSASQLDTTTLAVFRIAAGCLLVADAGLRSRDCWLFMAPEGMFPLAKIREFLGPSCWSLSFLSPQFSWQTLVLGLEALAGCLLAAGWFTRVASALAWVAWVSLLRRTAPALNAGDYWLSCLLFWSMFLPLGDHLSIDAWRRTAAPHRQRHPPSTVLSLASAAFVMQVLLVYSAAGLAKLQGTWLAGTAAGYALSLHDHGTPVGAALVANSWIATGLTWGTLALELIGPLAYWCCDSRQLRRLLASCFMLFHLGIWGTMTVGLFAPVGILAWIPLWPRLVGDSPPKRAQRPAAVSASSAAVWLFRCRQAVLVVALLVAGAAFLGTLWRPRQTLPRWLEVPVNLLCLQQSWAMFGDVGPLEQWVTGEALLADGRTVDLLRGGRAFVGVRPPGGFWSLPNHRWHKLFWELPKERLAPLRSSVAAGLVADWNQRHPATEAVVSLEIRTTRVTHPDRRNAANFPALTPSGIAASPAPNTVLRQWLIASWPPRSAGTGNLDRFLKER